MSAPSPRRVPGRPAGQRIADDPTPEAREVLGPPRPAVVRVGPYMTAHPLEITDRGEWEIRDRKGRLLGLVDWYAAWKQHVFTPERGVVLSHDCLAALSAFVRSPA